MSARRAILIAGPTASGKSALALRLAERLAGAIVNADSMQVYRDLRIVTARPAPQEESRAPHLLFGHIDAAEPYSVGRWLNEARAAMTDIAAQGRLPILVGGTGLYFKALTQGLSDLPAVPPETRRALWARSEGVATARLHAELAGRDPASAARLRTNDRQRVLRALEILEATGRPLADFQGERQGAVLSPGSFAGVFLAPDRENLYRRIDARFDAMIAAGALDEIRALAARGLDPALPAMRAHGAPWLMSALRGEMGITDAIARAKADTRHYAKRQFTWFRHQGEGFRFLSPEEADTAILGQLDRNGSSAT